MDSRTGSSISGCRILVAEDGRDLSQVYRALLERSGAEVTVAYDGRAALEACRQGRPFDGALIDLSMPRMRGTEVTARLRASGFTGALIGVSASATAEQAELWVAAGCDAVVAKDRPWAELAAILAEAIAQRQSQCRAAPQPVPRRSTKSASAAHRRSAAASVATNSPNRSSVWCAPSTAPYLSSTRERSSADSKSMRMVICVWPATSLKVTVV
jgi:CheY-like chemotaxis protein